MKGLMILESMIKDEIKNMSEKLDYCYDPRGHNKNWKFMFVKINLYKF
ncbi:hypothetical protein [Clostridium sp. ZS2-4]|nr:hypothetical protein [Clostridium sp. ZS2-4]MCY6356192.1 hypothetical protein [Clostridium sp. ZS2-4]